MATGLLASYPIGARNRSDESRRERLETIRCALEEAGIEFAQGDTPALHPAGPATGFALRIRL